MPQSQVRNAPSGQRLTRRPPAHEVSPQSIQQGSFEGIPVPEAVRGLRIEIGENVQYKPAPVAPEVRKYMEGDGG